MKENEETSASGRENKTDPDKRAVLSVLGDHDTRADRGEQESNNQGQHLETRGCGRLLAHDLEEQGHEEHNTEKAHTDKERGQEDSVVSSGLEQAEWDDGLHGLLPFDEQEDANDGEATDQEANDDRRVPLVGRATPVQGQEDHDETNDQGDRAQDVDTLELFSEGTDCVGEVKQLDDHGKGNGTDLNKNEH